MPDGKQIQETLTAPLAALEELMGGPAEAMRQGFQQLNLTAQGSGLLRVPEPANPPKVFRR